jgi:hypothetical protein
VEALGEQYKPSSMEGKSSILRTPTRKDARSLAIGLDRTGQAGQGDSPQEVSVCKQQTKANTPGLGSHGTLGLHTGGSGVR